MMNHLSPIARLVGLALMTSLVAIAASFSPSKADDDDEIAIRREEARRSFVENCLMCHGEDMTNRQRLTTKQWTAEVEKMVGWGSPLPLDRKQPVIDYLAEMYPHTKKAPAPERITANQALEGDRQPPIKPLPDARAERGAALFVTHCASCHGSNAKGGELGTNLVEKPVLLRVDEFRTLLKEGRRKMPNFAAVLDEAKKADLLAWLRTQK
jgi:mono/diheme cytochrome c family protein